MFPSPLPLTYTFVCSVYGFPGVVPRNSISTSSWNPGCAWLFDSCKAFADPLNASWFLNLRYESPQVSKKSLANAWSRFARYIQHHRARSRVKKGELLSERDRGSSHKKQWSLLPCSQVGAWLMRQNTHFEMGESIWIHFLSGIWAAGH